MNSDYLIILELTLEQKQAKQLELEGIEFCNSNQSEQALNKFNAAAELWPNRASIYNNRAQVYRLINRIDGKNQVKNQVMIIMFFNYQMHLTI